MVKIRMHTFSVLALLVLAANGVSMGDSIVLISNSTPQALVNYFSEASAVFNLDLLNEPSLILELERLDFLFFVDITLELSSVPALNNLATYFQASYVSISIETTTFKLRACVHQNYQEEAQSLHLLINQQQVSQYILLASSKVQDQQVSMLLASMSGTKLFSYISYQEEITLKVAKNLVGKMIKSKGITSLVIIDSSQALSTLEQVLAQRKVIKTATFLLYSPRSFSANLFEGSFFLTDFNTTISKNISEYHFSSILTCLNFINSNFPNIMSRPSMTQALQFYKSQNSIYTVSKIQSSSPLPVAEIYLQAGQPLLSIMNSSALSLPLASKTGTKLLFSIANGTNDPYHLDSLNAFSYVDQAATYAVYRSNLLKEIPNYYMELFPTDCGCLWYDAYWYTSCFSSVVNDLGIAMITSFETPAILGNLITLRELDHVIPQISPLGGNNDAISNKTEYPELVALQSSQYIYVSTMINILKSLGYSDLILIASNDTAAFYANYLFCVEAIQSVGMKIVNDEAFRFVTDSYDRSQFSNYSALFNHIKQTRCTVFYISITGLPMFIEGLYDIGYRKGEFVSITDGTLATALNGIPEPYYSKRKELIPGTLILSYREWVGELGEELEKEMRPMFAEITYMCMSYDAVSVLKEAIIYLLSIGEDYEDYSTLMNIIRTNKIQSCLGQLYFDPDGNYRDSVQFLVQQMFLNVTNRGLQFYSVAYYDRYSDQIFTYIAPYNWSTGVKPPNYIPSTPCPFDAYQIVSSDKGKSVLYGMAAFFTFIGILSGIFTICAARQNELRPIERNVISFSDYLFFFYFIVEFFQFITMGPDQDAYKEVVNNFQILFSFDFSAYFTVTFAEFWGLYYFVYAITAIWILMIFSHLIALDTLFQNFFIWKKFCEIATVAIPLIGLYGFLPILSMLMNIYICSNGIGTDLTDSYLSQDCTMFCYTSSHIIYAVFSAVLLLIFIPLIISHKDYFEKMQETLHISTETWYLVSTSWVQIVLVVFNKTVKIADQTIHGILVTGTVTVFCAATLYFSPHNYHRANIFHSVALGAAIWAIGTTTFFRNFDDMSLWIATEFIGILIILVIGGVAFKKSSEVLYSEKGRDISTLFLFQFCKDYKSYIKDPGSLDLTVHRYLVS